MNRLIITSEQKRNINARVGLQTPSNSQIQAPKFDKNLQNKHEKQLSRNAINFSPSVKQNENQKILIHKPADHSPYSQISYSSVPYDNNTYSQFLQSKKDHDIKLQMGLQQNQEQIVPKPNYIPFTPQKVLQKKSSQGLSNKTGKSSDSQDEVASMKQVIEEQQKEIERLKLQLEKDPDFEREVSPKSLLNDGNSHSNIKNNELYESKNEMDLKRAQQHKEQGKQENRQGIKCDQCDRINCSICHNQNLCYACGQQINHDQNHQLVNIKTFKQSLQEQVNDPSSNIDLNNQNIQLKQFDVIEQSQIKQNPKDDQLDSPEVKRYQNQVEQLKLQQQQKIIFLEQLMEMGFLDFEQNMQLISEKQDIDQIIEYYAK